ncbi:ArsR/SmtB family transcription factor [Nocardioides pacificus]
MTTTARGQEDAAALREHSGPAAALLKTISNERRLVICCLLLEADRSVGELGEALADSHSPLAQSALSQHLALLRDAGVVTAHREGQHVRYALAAGPAVGIIGALHAAYCRPQPNAQRST